MNHWISINNNTNHPWFFSVQYSPSVDNTKWLYTADLSFCKQVSGWWFQPLWKIWKSIGMRWHSQYNNNYGKNIALQRENDRASQQMRSPEQWPAAGWSVFRGRDKQKLDLRRNGRQRGGLGKTTQLYLRLYPYMYVYICIYYMLTFVIQPPPLHLRLGLRNKG